MRDQRIETLRGMALLFVLMHHAESGSWVGEYVSETVKFVMMPVFAAISGYLLGMKPVHARAFPKFLSAKLLRIGIPMMVCLALMLTLLFLFPSVVRLLYTAGPPDSFRTFARFFCVHPSTYWFLQSILAIYVMVGFLDSRGWLDSAITWGLIMAGSAGFLLTPVEVTGWFSLDGVQFLSPYFLLGFGFSRFDLNSRLESYKIVILISSVVFMAFFQYCYFASSSIGFGQGEPLGVLGSLLLTSTLFIWRGTFPWLAKLGEQSFGIYLFHRVGWFLGMLLVPFSAKLGGLDLLVHAGLMLLVGWLLTSLAGLSNVTRILFLGEKPRKPALSIPPARA